MGMYKNILKNLLKINNDKKTKTKKNKLSSEEYINAKLSHIEDMCMDNREIMIKLVQQGNQIVEFLKDIQVEEVTVPEDDGMFPLPKYENEDNPNKDKSIKKLLEEFMQQKKDWDEFQEELDEKKDMITPGQAGES
jgi:Fe2+ transport system protein B